MYVYIGCRGNHSGVSPFLNVPIPGANPDKVWSTPWDSRAGPQAKDDQTVAAVQGLLELNTVERDLLRSEARMVFEAVNTSNPALFQQHGGSASAQEQLDLLISEFFERWGGAFNITKKVVAIALRQMIRLTLNASNKKTASSMKRATPSKKKIDSQKDYNPSQSPCLSPIPSSPEYRLHSRLATRSRQSSQVLNPFQNTPLLGILPFIVTIKYY
jgi:hypothetical protein